MRKLLGTLVIVVLIISAIGLYRGWFRVSTKEQPGETNVEIKIDKERIREDTQEATRKAKEFGGGESEPGK
jgi:hypothetical protein